MELSDKLISCLNIRACYRSLIFLKGGRAKGFREQATLRPYLVVFRPHVGVGIGGRKAVAASHPGIGPGAEMIGNYLQLDSVHHALATSYPFFPQFILRLLAIYTLCLYAYTIIRLCHYSLILLFVYTIKHICDYDYIISTWQE